jgi:hypothetical protein
MHQAFVHLAVVSPQSLKNMETKSFGNRPGDEAVQAKTGKTWAEWLAVLDAAGAAGMSHKEIVEYLHARHNVGPWWRQSITVAYEQERGLRLKHEKPEGFQISRSKTVNAPLVSLYEAWSNEKLRQGWLADPGFTARKATSGKSMRITWVDGTTSVEVNFYDKGGEKAQVTVQHSKLPGSEEAERMKVYWEENLARLKDVLESDG